MFKKRLGMLTILPLSLYKNKSLVNGKRGQNLFLLCTKSFENFKWFESGHKTYHFVL